MTGLAFEEFKEDLELFLGLSISSNQQSMIHLQALLARIARIQARRQTGGQKGQTGFENCTQ